MSSKNSKTGKAASASANDDFDDDDLDNDSAVANGNFGFPVSGGDIGEGYEYVGGLQFVTVRLSPQMQSRIFWDVDDRHPAPYSSPKVGEKQVTGDRVARLRHTDKVHRAIYQGLLQVVKDVPVSPPSGERSMIERLEEPPPLPFEEQLKQALKPLLAKHVKSKP